MLRQLGRALDFSVLLVTLSMRMRLPAFSELRKMSFVELGPGPTRMRALKRFFFRQVFFIDQCDFGMPDSQLRLVDIETCGDVQRISDLCGVSPNAHGFFLFADHCVEHLTPDAALGLLRSAADRKLAACFRVPNIESPVGRRNFAGDPTHHTAFDQTFRRSLGDLGYVVSPWVRWYRLGTLMKVLMGQVSLMSAADEIVVSANFS